MEPVPGAPSDNTTLTAELDELRRQGYDGDIVLRDGPLVCCRSCDHCVGPDELQVDVFRRLENESIVDLRTPRLEREHPSGVKGTVGVHIDEDDFSDILLLAECLGALGDQKTIA